jgi:hypothetical protein
MLPTPMTPNLSDGMFPPLDLNRHPRKNARASDTRNASFTRKFFAVKKSFLQSHSTTRAAIVRPRGL